MLNNGSKTESHERRISEYPRTRGARAESSAVHPKRQKGKKHSGWNAWTKTLTGIATVPIVFVGLINCSATINQAFAQTPILGPITQVFTFKSVTKDTQFYVNQDGNLVLVFNQGDVAPMYMGVCEFVIPNNIVHHVEKAAYLH